MAIARVRLISRSLGLPLNYATTRKLKPQREAARLVRVGRAPDDGKLIRLTPRAAAAWRRLREAAAREGIELLPLSGFRSVARQTEIIRAKLAAGQPLAAILRVNAAPGYSEHHTGRALDLGTSGHEKLDAGFARTAAFRWLARRAGEFGFRLSYPRRNRHGIAYEPWHWCWQP